METISRKDLTIAWLAGMIDADGCIAFARMVQNRRSKKTYHLNIYTDIVTTCTFTKDFIDKAYDELGIPHHISAKNNGENAKQIYVIKVHGLKRNKRLLPLLLPYLVTKKREAELMLEFIEIRERLFAKKQHDPREDAIVEEVKQIKANRNIVKNPQRLYARLR